MTSTAASVLVAIFIAFAGFSSESTPIIASILIIGAFAFDSAIGLLGGLEKKARPTADYFSGQYT